MAKKTRTEIEIEVDGSGKIKVQPETTPADVIEKINYESEHRIVAARFNNKVVRLSYPLTGDGRLSFVALDTSDGMSVYRRSLGFVMIRAARELFPGARVYIRHSLSKGYYCEIGIDRALEMGDLEKLEARMREIVDADEPFVRLEVPVEEALRISPRYSKLTMHEIL